MQVTIKPVKAILSRSQLPGSEWAANPYLGCSHRCVYCYARFMQRHRTPSAQTGPEEADPWGSFVEVKDWPALDPYKDAPRLLGHSILIGSVTDPYLPEEAQYQRTRTLLQQLLAIERSAHELLVPDEPQGLHITLITKSDLLLRDLDLLRALTQVQVVLSINTLDDTLQRQLDAAPPIGRRLAALKACQEAGLATACFIAPIMPGLTEVATIVHAVRPYCREIWLDRLNLHPSCKEPVHHFISRYYPHLQPLYRAIYEEHDLSYWHLLERYLRTIARACALPYATTLDVAPTGAAAPIMGAATTVDTGPTGEAAPGGAGRPRLINFSAP